MCHTGGPEQVPVRALDRALIAHHQGGNQPGLGALWHGGKNLFAQALAQSLHRVPGRVGQAHWHWVSTAGAYIASGLHALLPQPQFVIKAVWVARAVWGLEPHHHLPALSRSQGLGLYLQLDACLGAHNRAAVPAQVNFLWQTHGDTLGARGLKSQTKTQPRLVPLRHARDQAGDKQITALQLRRQGLGAI